MKKIILGVALAAMMGGTARADAVTDDVHCLLIFMQMSNVQAQAAQTGGLIGSFYYMGKLDGRAAGLDLESLIMAEIPKMTEAGFQADAKRCGEEMTRRGNAASDMGKDLQIRGAQMLAPEQKPDQAPNQVPTQTPAAKPEAAPAQKPQ